MPRLSHMTVLALALAAGSVIAAVLFRWGATDAVGAVLTMGFIVILASYFDLLFERTEERGRIGAAFDHLGHVHDQLRSDADLTRRALVELKTHVDDRITARNDRIVSEVKVLESLIQRLAMSIADRAREVEPDEIEDEEELAQPYPDNVVAGPMGPDDEEMLETIRRSLEDNRVDLYLQPVVSLPQRKVRFYEALSRLRAEDGTLIMPSQYIRVAEPAGLMSLVDNVLLFRCIQVVRRWAQRNKEIGVFCNLSRETLRDANFFTQFADFMRDNRELSGQLIFEISQATFEDVGHTEDSNLKLLAEMGFSFSMDKVTNLDIDVAKARHYQVRHVKVPTALLLGDPDDTGATVHPADLKDLLSRFGLNLIAERVETERDVLSLLDYNVDFGQVFLFGEPRPIRETVLGVAHPNLAPASLAMSRPRAVSSGR
jgi:cyclic-di-GMP phosphodiesterase TipF (flagellum assembly factor)